jgi:hypothetical protein
MTVTANCHTVNHDQFERRIRHFSLDYLTIHLVNLVLVVRLASAPRSSPCTVVQAAPCRGCTRSARRLVPSLRLWVILRERQESSRSFTLKLFLLNRLSAPSTRLRLTRYSVQRHRQLVAREQQRQRRCRCDQLTRPTAARRPRRFRTPRVAYSAGRLVNFQTLPKL